MAAELSNSAVELKVKKGFLVCCNPETLSSYQEKLFAKLLYAWVIFRTQEWSQ